MSKSVPISKERHSGKSWQRFSTLSFAADTSAVPLVARELPMAALSMPVAFLREQDKYVLVGLLSLVPGQNLFVAPDGKWMGDYVPSLFRSYPFRLAKAHDGGQELVFCVDEDSGLISDQNQGESFFDESGELAKPVGEIFEFLKQIEQNRAGTFQAVSAMAEVGIIGEWELKVQIGEKETPVKGLYKVDEVKLANIGDDAFLKLRKAFAIPVIYSQLLSMGNVRVLQRLATVREQKQTTRDPDLGDFTLVDDSFKI